MDVRVHLEVKVWCLADRCVIKKFGVDNPVDENGKRKNRLIDCIIEQRERERRLVSLRKNEEIKNILINIFLRFCRERKKNEQEEIESIMSFVRSSLFKVDSMKILIIFLFVLFIQVIDGEERKYNFFMPDLPPPSRSSFISSSIATTRKIYPFPANSFTKIHLSGGPFNIKLYQNPNPNDNYTSVDVETEPSIHHLISVDVLSNDILSIRLIDNTNVINKTNVTVTINYSEITELNIDGMVNIQCLNHIQTDHFRLNNRAHGLIKLKLHVNTLDAYLHSIGRVKLCGQVNNEATIQSLGVGDVQCRNLFTKKINIISSGIGNLYVTATDEINITLSGIGTVYYTGPLKQQMKTGFGNIVEVPDSENE